VAGSWVVWPLASLTATVAYLLLLAAQITLAEARGIVGR
jgi:hypothetical protein